MQFKVMAQSFIGSQRITRTIQATDIDAAVKIASRQLDKNGYYYLVSVTAI